MNQESNTISRSINIIQYRSSNIDSQLKITGESEQQHISEQPDKFKNNVEQNFLDCRAEATSTHGDFQPRQIINLVTMKSGQDIPEPHEKFENNQIISPYTDSTKSLILHKPRLRTSLLKSVGPPLDENHNSHVHKMSASDGPHLEKSSEMKNMMSQMNCNKQLAKQLMSLMVNHDMKKYSGLTTPRIPSKSKNRSITEQSKHPNVLRSITSMGNKIIRNEIERNSNNKTLKCDNEFSQLLSQGKMADENFESSKSNISNYFKNSKVNYNPRKCLDHEGQSISKKENLLSKNFITGGLKDLNSNFSNLKEINYSGASRDDICSNGTSASVTSLRHVNTNNLSELISTEKKIKSKHNLNKYPLNHGIFYGMQTSDETMFTTDTPKTELNRANECILERKDLTMKICNDRLSVNDKLNHDIKPEESFLKNDNLKTANSKKTFLRNCNINASAKDRNFLNDMRHKTRKHADRRMNSGDTNVITKENQISPVKKEMSYSTKYVGIPEKVPSISVISSTVARSEALTEPHPRFLQQPTELTNSASSSSASSYPQSSSSPTSSTQELTHKMYVQTLTIPSKHGRERIVEVRTEPEQYRNFLNFPIQYDSKPKRRAKVFPTSKHSVIVPNEGKPKNYRYTNQTYLLTIPICVRSKVARHKHLVVTDSHLEKRVSSPLKHIITPRRVRSDNQSIIGNAMKIPIEIKPKDSSTKHDGNTKLNRYLQEVAIPTGRRDHKVTGHSKCKNVSAIETIEHDDNGKHKSNEHNRYSQVLTIPSKHKKRTFTIRLAADDNKFKSSRSQDQRSGGNKNYLQVLDIPPKPKIIILEEPNKHSNVLTIPTAPTPKPRQQKQRVDDSDYVPTYSPKIRSKTLTRRKVKGAVDKPKVELTSVMAKDSKDTKDSIDSKESKDSNDSKDTQDSNNQSDKDRSPYRNSQYKSRVGTPPVININHSSRIPRYQSNIKLDGKVQMTFSKPTFYIGLPPDTRPNTVNSVSRNHFRNKSPSLLFESSQVNNQDEIKSSMTDLSKNFQKEKNCFTEISPNPNFDKNIKLHFQDGTNSRKLFNKRVRSEMTLIKYNNLNLNSNATDGSADNKYSSGTRRGIQNKNIFSLPIKSCLKVKCDKVDKVQKDRCYVRSKSSHRIYHIKQPSMGRKRQSQNISPDKFFRSRDALASHDIMRVDNEFSRMKPKTDSYINRNKMTPKHRSIASGFNPYLSCKKNNVLTALTNKNDSTALKFIKNIFSFKLNKNVNAKPGRSSKSSKSKSRRSSKNKHYKISKIRESPSSAKTIIPKPSHIPVPTSKPWIKSDIFKYETPVQFFKNKESKKLTKDASSLSLVPSESSNVRDSPSSFQYFKQKLQLDPHSSRDIPPKYRSQKLALPSSSIISTTSSESLLSKTPDKTPHPRHKIPPKPPSLERNVHKFRHLTQPIGLSRSGSSLELCESYPMSPNELTKKSTSLSSSNIFAPSRYKDVLPTKPNITPSTTSEIVQFPYRTQPIGLHQTGSSTSQSSFYTLGSLKSEASSSKSQGQNVREVISKPEFSKTHPYRLQPIGMPRSGSESSVYHSSTIKQKYPVSLPHTPSQFNSNVKETRPLQGKSLKYNKEQTPRNDETYASKVTTPHVDYFTLKSAKLVSSIPKTTEAAKQSQVKSYVSTLKVDLNKDDQRVKQSLKKVESNPEKFQKPPYLNLHTDEDPKNMPMFDKNRLAKLTHRDKISSHKKTHDKSNKSPGNTQGHLDDHKKVVEENINKITIRNGKEIIPDGKSHSRRRVPTKLTRNKGHIAKDDQQIIEDHLNEAEMLAEGKSIKIHPKLIKEKEVVAPIPKVIPTYVDNIPEVTPKYLDKPDDKDERRKRLKSLQQSPKIQNRKREEKQTFETAKHGKENEPDASNKKQNKICDINLTELKKAISRKYARTAIQEIDDDEDNRDKGTSEANKTTPRKINDLTRDKSGKTFKRHVGPKSKDEYVEKIATLNSLNKKYNGKDDERVKIISLNQQKSRKRPVSITTFPVKETSKIPKSKKFNYKLPIETIPRDLNKGDEVDKKALKFTEEMEAEKATLKDETLESAEVSNIAKQKAKEVQIIDPKNRKVSLGKVYEVEIPTSVAPLEETGVNGTSVGTLTKIDKDWKNKRSSSAKRFREMEILKRNLQNLQNEVYRFKKKGSELTVEQLIKKLCQNLDQKTQDSSSDDEDSTLSSIDRSDPCSSDDDQWCLGECPNSSVNCNSTKLQDSDKEENNILYTSQRIDRKESQFNGERNIKQDIQEVIKQDIQPSEKAFDSNFNLDGFQPLNSNKESFKTYKRLNYFKRKTEEYVIRDINKLPDKENCKTSDVTSTKHQPKSVMFSHLCKDCTLELATEKLIRN